MNVTVYLGSSMGNDPAYRQAAADVGTWIGQHGHSLIYGGSCVGCMGVLADAVLDEGGYVIGVEPSFMIEGELQHEGISELIEVPSMADRMTKMIELGDAFVALPGGIGTLEEMSEVASRIRLNLTQAPCVFYNLNGYYDHIEAFFNQMVEEGFMPQDSRDKIVFARTLDEVVAQLR